MKQTKPTGHAKKKKPTTGRLKERAWKEFSRYIRLRDCIATTGTTEYGTCVACQKRYAFKELQAGHWIPGRTGSVLFNEDLVHAQCMRCNVWLHGNLSAYAMYMYSKYTKKQMAEFELLRAQVLPLKKHDYIEIAEKYKYKADRLLENF